jgi:hypothetical protein
MCSSSVKIWVKVPDFSIADMALKAACGINNIENFLVKILRLSLFVS